MYCFIIKILSHSSKQQNVCTHTHPNGHARKSCQITLVHTHGHTRGATQILTVQPGHRISARCTSAVPEAAAEPQRNAHTAPSSVPHTHAAKGDIGAAWPPTAAAAAAAHSCRCPAAAASTGSRGSVTPANGGGSDATCSLCKLTEKQGAEIIGACH